MRPWSAQMSSHGERRHGALPMTRSKAIDEDKKKRRHTSRSYISLRRSTAVLVLVALSSVLFLYKISKSKIVDDDVGLQKSFFNASAPISQMHSDEDPDEDEQPEINGGTTVEVKLGRGIAPYHFTIERGANGRQAKLISFGRNFADVHLPKSEILRQHSTELLGKAAFNLAILRMPEDTAWPFIGIARAPLNRIKHDTVPGARDPVELNSLLGFGLNLTSKGNFEVISKATFLQISMRPAFNCGIYAIYQGPEDPRPYWSDTGLPMMILGMPSMVGPGHCRGIGLIHDIRSTWPELTSILADSKLLPKFRAGAQGDELVELTRNGAGWQEKNWMPFFPGPKRNPEQVMPYIHYSSHPEEVLEPPQRSYRHTADEMSIYQYSMQRNPATDASACIVAKHPNVFDSVHGATPLYRLTLCKRGSCEPNHQNTIFVALNHYLMEADRNGARMYTRYFAFWSANDRITPVALGPMFHYNGVTSEEMIYALSMAFVPSNSTAEGQTNGTLEGALGSMHGFIDDRVFISMGVGDAGMATTELSIREEMLRGIRACSTRSFPSELRAWIADDS